MRFCVLGPLQAWKDGRELELGAGRQRALLLFLLLHADEVVSNDRLMDALWAERPPPTALKVLQGYISQLRRVLPPNTIVTSGSGYALRGAGLDAGEFEQLVAEAREQEPQEAARTLHTALALWRGRPFADVEYETWAQAEIARLDELRLVGLEERIEVDLRLGDAAHVVPELEGLVAEHPLRERMLGQLVLALYRAGRQADALAAYAAARRRLVGELGIEPGPELQDLQRRILAQDPALGAPRSLRMLPRVARRAHWLVLAGVLLIAAAASAAGVLLATGGSASSLLGPDEVAAIDGISLQTLAQIRIAGVPVRLATGSRSIWVGSDESGTLAAVDTRARSLTPTLVSISGFPSAIAVGEGAVWSLDGVRGVLSKVSPPFNSVSRSVRVSTPNPVYDRSRESLDPVAVAAGLGSVWTTDGSPSLSKVDPVTMKVRRIAVGVALDGVTVGDRAVWAISGAAAEAIALDRRGRVLDRIAIVSRPGFESPYPTAVAYGGGFLWVLNGNTATLTKIDPSLRAVVATIDIGVDRNPTRLVAGAGAAWVTDADGTLARVDANTNALEIRSVGAQLGDVAVVRRTIWVTTGARLGGHATASSITSVGRVRPLPTSSCSPIYYQGGSRPQYLVVADVALQGDGRALATQSAQAAHFVLEQHSFRAGRYELGFQVCDDSTVQAGGLSVARCAQDAGLYARNPSVIGVIGAWGSACSQAEVPIADRAPHGPLAMVSSSNTYVGLTHHGPGTATGEPSRYYPKHVRNYVRVTAADDVQGAADALLAHKLGATSIYVLDDGLTVNDGLAATVRAAAIKLGLRIAGSSTWNLKAKSYQPLVARVRRAHPGAVFFASFLLTESALFVKELHTELPRTPLLLTDGFAPGSGLISTIGAAADGITISIAEIPTDRLPAAGKEFATAFNGSIGNEPLSPFSVAEAQATNVLLDAIARSDGTRASVSSELFKTRVSNGILGSFAFDRNGDTTAGAVTIYRIVRGVSEVYSVITPPPALAH